MTTLLYNHIQRKSLVDGPGERVALFMQGCPLHCEGCQNPHLWHTLDAHEASAEHAAETMMLLGKDFTITGGEPFAQPQALYELVGSLRARGANSIIIYTGYTWEQLLRRQDVKLIKSIIHYVDIVVDGPFIKDKDDPFITWRGSRNQRPINAQASITADWSPVVEDWDDIIVINASGTVFAPEGMAAELFGANTSDTRMCGQTL